MHDEESERTFLAQDAADRKGAATEEVVIDPAVPPDVIAATIEAATHLARLGLILGVGVILAGVVVLVLGVSDAVTWKVEGLGGSSELQTGATGVVVAVIGLGVVFITRLNVRVQKALEPKK